MSYRSRGQSGRISPTLILSYVFDWFIIVAAAGIGAWLATITPNMRPFSLIDPNISFPHVEQEKISTVLMGICGAGIPMAIIFLVTFLLVPGPTVSKNTPQSLIWRRKLWEWHTGWLGLALSLSSAFLITQGMKNLFGKPRPDLLSRCQPDIDNIALYLTGSSDHYNVTNQGLPILVSAAICKQTDKHILDDGFRSFPSGHSSFSSAGLIYLSLYLASKLAISIPFLSPRAYSPDESHLSAFPSRAVRSPEAASLTRGPTPLEHDEPTGHNDRIIAARNEAAAPPVYLLAIAIIPWFASIYISATRWSDFRHHGFDILFGYTIGLITAVFAFRFYHLPIRQGAGWSWGPRSTERSFWAGIGVGSYAGTGDRVTEDTAKKSDIETGEMSLPKRRATNNDVGLTEESKIRDR
ncbi:hypothetical protein HYFRA_00002740 [Hymenoscyphus fraxineus]|uniref:Phosphatidic acid phosphatase type 2/haloperoxidase domain-containing protein n=1 Tax=Hymenoscyphus fraxineus TaxID=746836 RepID=A0A9N9KPS4_9HELO|nr:hypothetical protein HYFRA_00002740 [Hymenoscyphus fraxineus]